MDGCIPEFFDELAVIMNLRHHVLEKFSKYQLFSTRLRRQQRASAVTTGLGLCLVLQSTPLLGEGFRNPPAGGFGLGRAGGRFTHVDDSSAVVHNPANLVGLQRSEVSLVPNFLNVQAEYKPAGGTTVEKSLEPWKFTPNVFAALPLSEGRWVAGLAVTTPYGVSSEWDPKTEP